ncbi:MAG: peptidase MA family metallohydrolase [Terriglobales bacterium]
MRASVIFLLWSGLLLGAAGASADVIRLKNGRTIYADQVHENGSHLEYEVGEDSYAIPKSVVDRIEAGGVPPEPASTKGSDDVPAITPPDNLKGEASVGERIIRDGKVDIDALAAIEQQGIAPVTAAAYFIAGKHDMEQTNFSKARTYFETALRFDGQNPTILNYYVALLVRTGNAAEALPYAERAVRIAPDSPDTLAILGYAQYASDRDRDAIRSWKRSLQLRPDAQVQKYLEKAERDASAESQFTENESSHFTLKYEGGQTPESLRRDLITTLESHYDDLVRDLGVVPRGSMAVILYTDQAFFDVTQSPSWASAVNDGKLRIPINGMTSVTPELSRVLKHELTHSFINQLSGGRCPQWLNEGIAQALEPKSLGSRGRRLAQLFQAQQEIPFNALEGSFMRLSSTEALLAYDESLAAVQFIIDTHGTSELPRILQRLSEGSSTESALRATVHDDYSRLQDDVGKYLSDKYGD